MKRSYPLPIHLNSWGWFATEIPFESRLENGTVTIRFANPEHYERTYCPDKLYISAKELNIVLPPFDPNDDSEEYDGDDLLVGHDKFWSTPSLKSLRMVNCRFPWTRWRFKDLTEIDITCRAVTRCLFEDEDDAPAEDPATIFRSFPNLKKLRLHLEIYVDDIWDPDSHAFLSETSNRHEERITMAHLRYVEIDAPPEYAMYILRSVAFADDIQELHITLRPFSQDITIDDILSFQYVPPSVFESIHGLRVMNRFGGCVGIDGWRQNSMDRPPLLKVYQELPYCTSPCGYELTHPDLSKTLPPLPSLRHLVVQSSLRFSLAVDDLAHPTLLFLVSLIQRYIASITHLTLLGACPLILKALSKEFEKLGQPSTAQQKLNPLEVNINSEDLTHLQDMQKVGSLVQLSRNMARVGCKVQRLYVNSDSGMKTGDEAQAVMQLLQGLNIPEMRLGITPCALIEVEEDDWMP